MKKILAIDDQKENLILLEAIISKSIPDCKIFLATSGIEGLKIAKKENPDTILLDIVMPKMDGYEVCRRLKSDEKTKNIPVIILTAIEKELENKIKGYKAGSDIYLTKPINPLEFLAQLKVMLRIKEDKDKLKEENKNLDKKLDKTIGELKKVENNTELFMNFSTDNYTLWNSEMHLIDININALKYFPKGTKKEDIIGKHMLDIYPGIMDKGRYNKYLKVIETGISFCVDEFISDTGGEEKKLSLKAFRAGDGIGIISSDISEIKKFENDKIEARSKFRNMLENSMDGVAIFDENLLHIYTNPKFSEITGYSCEELSKMYGWELVRTNAVSDFKQKYNDCLNDENKHSLYESILVKKNGIEVPVELSVTEVIWEGKKCPIAFIKDITDKKLQEKEILEMADTAMQIVEFPHDKNLLDFIGMKILELIGDGIVVVSSIDKVKVSFNNIFGVSKIKSSVLKKLLKNIFDEINYSEYILKAIDNFSKGILIKFKGQLYLNFIKNLPKILQLQIEKYINKKDIYSIGLRHEGNIFGNITIIITENKKINKNIIETFINQASIALNSRKVENNLRLSKEHFKKLSNLTFEGIVIHNNGLIIDVNESIIKMTGFSREELIGESMVKYCLPEDYDTKVKKNIKRNYLKPYEIIGRKKDGTLFPVEIEARNIEENNKKIRVIAIRDISERKKSELILKDSEERFKKFSKLTLEAIIIHKDGIILDVNESTSRISGYSREELIGVDLFDLGIVDNFRSFAKEKSKETIVGPYEIFAKRKDGSLLPIEVEARYLNEGNNSIRVIAIKDITERKIAKDNLKESEERFKEMTNLLPQIVFEIDLSGKVKFVNKQAFKIFGYSEDDINEDFNVLQIVAPEDRSNVQKNIKKILNGENIKAVEYIAQCKNGEKIPFLVNANLVLKNNKPIGLRGLAVDVSEFKRSEKIQKVLFNISNAVSITDNLTKLISFIQEELGKIIDTSNFYIAIYDNKTDTLSLPFFRDEKDEFDTFPAGKTVTYYVIKTGKSLLAKDEEIIELEKSGDVERFGSVAKVWVGVPLRVDGEIIGVLSVQSYTDENAYTQSDLDILEFVSDQIGLSIHKKKAEDDLIKALEQSKESDRLKSVFLASMSHELRTPLNSVIGFSDIIEEDTPIDEIIDYVKLINVSGLHLLNIVEDIFDVTLIEAGETKIIMKDFNLHELLVNVHKVIFEEFKNKDNKKENVDLKLVLDPNDKDLIINSDLNKIEQILINLLKNAFKFTHKGLINYGYKIKKENNNSEILFYVEDTGIGIPENKKELIFDVFRQVDDTNTRRYGGTGIGLTICKKLTELLGGKIWLESDLGKGSTFYFTLPLNHNEKLKFYNLV